MTNGAEIAASATALQCLEKPWVLTLKARSGRFNYDGRFKVPCAEHARKA